MKKAPSRPVSVPKWLLIPYCAVAASATLVVYLFGWPVVALSILAVAFCGFVLMDILLDWHKRAPLPTGETIRAVLSCIFVCVCMIALLAAPFWVMT